MKYFLDTHALVEIAEGNPRYQRYVESDAVTLKDNLAELFYFLLKNYDEKVARFFFTNFSALAVELPLPVLTKAMIFRYKHRNKHFSYIDCFGYIYAVEHRMFFLTGDRAFQGMEHVDLVR